MQLKAQIFPDPCKPRRNLKPTTLVGGRRKTKGLGGKAVRRKRQFSCFTKFQMRFRNIKEELKTHAFILGGPITVSHGIFEYFL